MTTISNSEMEIMRIIWAQNKAITGTKVLEALPSDNRWKITTVLTFLARLAEKEMLTVQKIGKTNYYTATKTAEEYKASETRAFLETTHGGSVQSFIATLYDSDISQNDIDELKKWLAQR